MAGGKVSEKKLKLAERRHRAIALRKAGISFRSIAQAIAREFPNDFPNYSYSMAVRDVHHVFDELNTQSLEDAAILRRLHSERLDSYLMAITRQAQGGDLQAIDRCIRIVEASAKLWGLNLPPEDRPISETTTTGIEFELIMPDLVESRN